MIYESSLNIKGLEIIPGTVDDIKLQAIRKDVLITRNKLLWF